MARAGRARRGPHACATNGEKTRSKTGSEREGSRARLCQRGSRGSEPKTMLGCNCAGTPIAHRSSRIAGPWVPHVTVFEDSRCTSLPKRSRLASSSPTYPPACRSPPPPLVCDAGGGLAKRVQQAPYHTWFRRKTSASPLCLASLRCAAYGGGRRHTTRSDTVHWIQVTLERDSLSRAPS